MGNQLMLNEGCVKAATSTVLTECLNLQQLVILLQCSRIFLPGFHHAVHSDMKLNTIIILELSSAVAGAVGLKLQEWTISVFVHMERVKQSIWINKNQMEARKLRRKARRPQHNKDKH